MKSLKSLFKPTGVGGGGNVKVTAAPSTSTGGGGEGGWEDFSTFSSNTPTPPPIARDEEPHPLTKDWAARINNRNVRAAFLKEPIEGYTAAHDLRVWTGTWNTNGKSPPPNLDISEWLKTSSSSGSAGGAGGAGGVGRVGVEPYPDVVVVGFQEIVPLTPGKVLAVEDSAATAEWEAIIGKALNDGGGGGPSTGAAAAAARANTAANAPVADPFVVENLWSGKPIPAGASASTTASGGEGWTNFDAPSGGGGGGAGTMEGGGAGGGGGGGTAAGAVAGAGAAGEGEWTSFDAPSPAAGGGRGDNNSFNNNNNDGAGAGGSGDGDGDGERPTYVRLACKQLVGVYITVWATVEVASHARDVRVNTVSTGINLGLGVLGNKGGAAVWMKIYATPVVFICSHLSAGTKEGDELKRSEDHGEILSKLSFPPPPATSSDGSSQSAATVADAFAAVWIGDLNYRLNLPDDAVRAALAAGEHLRLITGDQLLAEQKAGRAFVGWTEAPVTFPPTYKYRPGTNVYSGAGAGAGVTEGDDNGDDTGGSGDGGNGGGGGGNGGNGGGVPVNMKEEKKKRTPAWCDRVLWRGRDIRQLSYARAELVQSDHKPVMADFTLTARELQPERLQGVLQNLRRRLDAAEMASQPRCTIENPQADLRELRYAEPKSTSFRFVNTAGNGVQDVRPCDTGDVPATWRFVPAMPGEPALCPAWLSLAPVEGRLLPGEEVEIRATACVRGGGAAGPAAITGTAAAVAAADASGVGGTGGDGGRGMGGAGGGGGELDGLVGGGGVGGGDATAAGAALLASSLSSLAVGISGGGVGGGVGGGAASGGVGEQLKPPASSEAGTMAEAARRAAVRAVGSGLATPTAGGGVTAVGARAGAGARPQPPMSRRGSTAALASLAELPDHPLDAIIVLHLDEGRDFFLTVAGQYVPSVFGQPLASLPSAAFPPDVPEPVGTLVDHLFDKGLQHVPALLQPPTHARCTLRGLAAVRGALDIGWGGAADLAGTPGVDCHEVAGALLSFFASLPRPLLASPPMCCAAIDAAMAPWAATAAAAARAAGPGGGWTLATPDVARLLPAPSAADELLRKHLAAPERATCKHTTAFLHALLKAPPLPGTMPASAAAARILAQLAEVWFPVVPPGGARRGGGGSGGGGSGSGGGNAAAAKMGRLAFIGVLCGAHPGFLDGFNPMERMYDPEGNNVGGGEAGSSGSSAAAAGSVGGVGAAAAVGVGGAGVASVSTANANNSGGNLIDF